MDDNNEDTEPVVAAADAADAATGEAVPEVETDDDNEAGEEEEDDDDGNSQEDDEEEGPRKKRKTNAEFVVDPQRRGKILKAFVATVFLGYVANCDEKMMMPWPKINVVGRSLIFILLADPFLFSLSNAYLLSKGDHFSLLANALDRLDLLIKIV